jgi:methylated-DNA-[protein]-cysteine S-methyltransferase
VTSATTIFDAPVGPLFASASAGRLVRLSFHSHLGEPQDDGDVHNREVLEQTKTQLVEYFDGRRVQFDVPLDLRGSEFYRRVWRALLEIPYGETVSYGELARRVGSPSQARAVGTANGANPIAIIVPCHRVIGADGTLVGYGGGLWRKRMLLDLEDKRLALALEARGGR